GGVERLVDTLLGGEDAPIADAAMPESVGPYHIRSVLGEGGMGVVYLAEQTEPIRREVALKLIRGGADSAAVLLQAADAFAQEGRWDVAQAIYERIVERYGGTPAAAAARARMSAPESERPQRPSRVELQVFGA
ncbi:hypothetical protein DF186_14135, partial [Enterococcus hirae]